MILYSFRRCPYAMRARMALKYSGIALEHREIILKNKPEAMLEASPKGTVPVLVLSDGRVIDESLDIMRWSLQQFDPKQWIPQGLPRGLKTSIQELIRQNDESFKPQLDRYKYPNRYPNRYPDEDTSLAQTKAFSILKIWNNQLTETNHLLSNEITLADIAVFPFVRQFRNVDKNTFKAYDLKHLEAWLEKHINSDLFQSIMIKHPLWAP